MDMSGLLMTSGAAVLVTHCAVFSSEVSDILQRVGHAVWYGFSPSNEQMEAAVWDARIKQYRSSSRACMHIAAICTCGQMIHLQWNHNAHSTWPFLISMSAWLMHLLISSNILPLGRARCRLFVVVMYLMVGIWIAGYPSDCQNALILTSVSLCVRFAVATFFVDFQVGVPAQSLLSLLETWNAWKLDPSSIHIIFINQLTVSAFILVLAGLMEFNNRSRIALLTNSESMVHSFRRVLRGVCDGEVLLDSKLRISGEAGCLQTLLMVSDSDFCNKNFEELLMEDERERFRSFMSEGKGATASSGITAPPCLRVSLKRAICLRSNSCPRVGVDLFHVPLMLGEETYHLIVLREDSDSRSQLEVLADEHGGVQSPKRESVARNTARIGQRLLFFFRRRSLSGSDASVSQVSSSSLLQICRELEEMTLLARHPTQNAMKLTHGCQNPQG
ncbi:unnamed protein product [Effrenium voratum]|uniref:Uncharacterized protein n=1 Tax=Effrenium voratum TaxID=2562239 RepID=A0AA36JNE7_9DINO|nr:unnamed protein product [Effrenium voratum]